VSTQFGALLLSTSTTADGIPNKFIKLDPRTFSFSSGVDCV
jgi:hypothetical protein